MTENDQKCKESYEKFVNNLDEDQIVHMYRRTEQGVITSLCGKDKTTEDIWMQENNSRYYCPECLEIRINNMKN